MPSPIEIMIDRSGLRCTRCGTPKGEGCNCWEPINLRCPKCSKAKSSYREPSDPKGTKLIEAVCNQCYERGLCAPIRYFDTKGKELPTDTGSVT